MWITFSGVTRTSSRNNVQKQLRSIAQLIKHSTVYQRLRYRFSQWRLRFRLLELGAKVVDEFNSESSKPDSQLNAEHWFARIRKL